MWPKREEPVAQVYFVLLGESVGQVSSCGWCTWRACHHYVAREGQLLFPQTLISADVHLELGGNFLFCITYALSKFYFTRRRTFVSSFFKVSPGSSLLIFVGLRL